MQPPRQSQSVDFRHRPENPPIDITGGCIYDTSVIRAVIDTNVIVAALKSSKGASYELLLRMDAGRFQPAVSVALVTEYEDVLFRPTLGIRLSHSQIDAVLDRICQIGINQPIYYLWRPFLSDPKDDMVFETALASGSTHIVTFNLSDFRPARQFGIEAITPGRFLLKL